MTFPAVPPRQLVAAEAASIRRVELPQAFADTERSGLSLSARMVAALDLMPLVGLRSRSPDGMRTARALRAARLQVQRRECTGDVIEAPDDAAALIGRVPLLMLEFVVDPADQRFIGNPTHGGQQMI